MATSTWAPIDLTDALAGQGAEEAPQWLFRSDGLCLLYSGRVHSIFGEPECGKSWLAATAAVVQLRAALDVLVLDFEDSAASWVNRLRALGVPDEQLRAHFHYANPEEPADDEVWTELESVLESAALIVVDGVNEAGAVQGLDLHVNADYSAWNKAVIDRLRRRAAAVVLIDHVTKNKETRGGYAIGAQGKKGQVDVAFEVKAVAAFGRGKEGRSAIYVKKDRPGFLRQHEDESRRIALMHVRPGGDDALSITLEPPEAGDPDEWRPTVLMERVSRFLEGNPGSNKTDIRTLVSGKSEAKDHALSVLIRDGYVNPKREGQAVRHTSIRPYREADDPKTLPQQSGQASCPPAPACPSPAPTLPHGQEGDSAPLPPSLIDGARGRVPLAPSENQETTLTIPTLPGDDS